MSLAEGPYTTITVASFNHLKDTISVLRDRIQRARQSLEQGAVAEALQVLKFEEDKP